MFIIAILYNLMNLFGLYGALVIVAIEKLLGNI